MRNQNFFQQKIATEIFIKMSMKLIAKLNFGLKRNKKM